VAQVRRASIYRLLHGAPMLGGVPAHYVLVLLGAATVFGLGSMSVSKMIGIAVLGLVGIVWMGLAFVYGQDRTQMSVMLLRARFRFARRIESYSPAPVVVRFEEE
jgi:hypothetical protein